jgi:hypothetical protein
MMDSKRWAAKATVVVFGMIFFIFPSCVTVRYKPCTNGGQPARDSTAPFRGTKRCYQTVDEAGYLVNHGKYLEWHANEKIAVTGEYKLGKKTGRWMEYDEKGNKVLDKYYEDGKEVVKP